ncbi:unnamed protein product [Ectocarpus sp. 12 AP-2014]
MVVVVVVVVMRSVGKSLLLVAWDGAVVTVVAALAVRECWNSHYCMRYGLDARGGGFCCVAFVGTRSVRTVACCLFYVLDARGDESSLDADCRDRCRGCCCCCCCRRVG